MSSKIAIAANAMIAINNGQRNFFMSPSLSLPYVIDKRKSALEPLPIPEIWYWAFPLRSRGRGYANLTDNMANTKKMTLNTMVT